MRWDVVQTSMLDELAKIAEISLSGLSPKTLLEHGQPAPPMGTPGLSKALAILDRYEAMPKTASAPSSVTTQAGITTVTAIDDKGKKKKVHIIVADPVKSFGAHSVGGAAAGKFLAELAQKNKVPSSDLRRIGKLGAGIGAGIGTAEFARKKIVAAMRRNKGKTKKAMISSVFSPKTALRATQTVAKPKIGFHSGSPHLSTIAKGSTIGRKFNTPL